MKIHFTRDSVAMADNSEVADFSFPDDAEWDQIIPTIKNNYFLALVYSDNVVWVLHNEAGHEILAYYPMFKRAIRRTQLTKLSEICGGTEHLHFTYITSMGERRHQLELDRSASITPLWGWNDEYHLYGFRGKLRTHLHMLHLKFEEWIFEITWPLKNRKYLKYRNNS